GSGCMEAGAGDRRWCCLPSLGGSLGRVSGLPAEELKGGTMWAFIVLVFRHLRLRSLPRRGCFCQCFEEGVEAHRAFCVQPRGRSARLELRSIPPGGEIFVSYGNDYWRCSHILDTSDPFAPLPLLM